MSIVKPCPYDINGEHCKYEIYYGEPILSKCKNCIRAASKQSTEMTDEEKAEEYYYKTYPVTLNIGEEERKKTVTDIFLAGLKASRPKWHKVADGDLPKGEEYGKNDIHRKIYLKDHYGNIYTGNYYPKDKDHKADCFAVEFLDWGVQGSQFCEKSQIVEWREITEYAEN